MRRRPSPDLTPATPEEIEWAARGVTPADIAAALGVTPEEIAAALAPDDAGPPEIFRYMGGCLRVPERYIGEVCRLAVGRPPARRLTSRRVEFEDGFVVTMRARLLHPIAEPITG
jgi:hypothetical protein